MMFRDNLKPQLNLPALLENLSMLFEDFQQNCGTRTKKLSASSSLSHSLSAYSLFFLPLCPSLCPILYTAAIT